MKVCVFEWINGGGCLMEGVPVTSTDADFVSLLAQGRQMLAAVIEDMSLAGHEVCWLKDSRMSDLEIPFGFQVAVDRPETLRQTLLTQVSQSDATLLIAPETKGCLSSVCQWLTEFSDRLISPDLEFIRLTSEKHQTCHWLKQRNIPVPEGCLSSEFDAFRRRASFPPPWVVKPNDGAGSEHVRLVQNEFELDSLERSGPCRIEAFIAGTAASVSVLHYGTSFELLLPTQQIFDADPIGHYVGARPLKGALAQRATELARRTVLALPPTRGYFGIDLVLAEHSPSCDTVIEVNPRLTLSYLWLRQRVNFNLAQRMLVGITPSVDAQRA